MAIVLNGQMHMMLIYGYGIAMDGHGGAVLNAVCEVPPMSSTVNFSKFGLLF